MRWLRLMTCCLLLAAVLVSAKNQRHVVLATFDEGPTITSDYLDRAQVIGSRKDGNHHVDRLCRLHRVVVSKHTVPIIYGFIELTHQGRAIARAEDAYFPNAKDDVSGGCIPDRLEKAFVWECEKCRQEKRDWLASH